ncbi:phage tail protein [Pseudomonas azerbaijanorientalis]|uniref:phage tail protein n=1 Tax=Pseudomonas azerbaijanorientalis TaxID=2842350 RepID=UPI001C3D9990|nr:phage tail protein [Pseudomonas azerbaijanorientalis]QXH64255.1 phage tail protein [Pseudomonas azerbaijanorientalis]
MADEKTYLQHLQGGLKYMVDAGEAGRTDLESMTGPMNGALNEISGAADALEGLPSISEDLSDKTRRLQDAINSAQAKIGKVASYYNQTQRALAQFEEHFSALTEQISRFGAAFNKVAGKANAALGNIFPTEWFAGDMTPIPDAVKPFPHLLIIYPLKANERPYYFNLDTAAFDELRRQTSFRWAAQERLTRRPAQQAVGLGEEKITIKGAIYPSFKGGLKQLDTLRSIGAKLLPLNLTTGYGEVLGNWCLTNIEEEQSALLPGAIPRKQGFSLEFVRYGDDLQNG